MSERLTVLLTKAQGGDRAARDALFAAAYQDPQARLSEWR